MSIITLFEWLRAINVRALFLAAWLVPALVAAPAPDSLGRDNPRSSVTAFLETCQNRDYRKAAQYLDMRQLSPAYRDREGPTLAKQLEAILNSDTHFNPLNLDRRPEGDPSDDPDQNREHVAITSQDGRNFTLDLERVTLQPGGPQVWLFSPDTVAAIPNIHASTIAPAIERYLPPFLVAYQFLETPLWKWLALIVLALLLVSLSRLVDRLLVYLVKLPQRRFQWSGRVPWLEAIIQPLRVMLVLALLRIGVGIIDPSAIARLYIGRAMELILVWSIGWCLIRLVDLFMNHLEQRLDTPQKVASRTMMRLGRRIANVTIVIFSILVILQNWGYNTSTLIAGLGVGGIAVALAAQQTLANIFGGVSLIGDHPIRVGDYEKFGDLTGVLEDIGMRSTRIRTLNRTIVSVPNSTFAGLNLENYSSRDKILFNPTFHIKSNTPDEQVRALIEAVEKMFAERRDLEPVPTPARLIGLASGSYSLELFCYVRTANIDEFYKIQSELLLRINDIFKASDVELA